MLVDVLKLKKITEICLDAISQNTQTFHMRHGIPVLYLISTVESV